MINRLIPVLSSIKIKLFLWFWLITICSILTTRFISNQLSEQMVNTTANAMDKRQLAVAARKLDRFSNLPPNEAIKKVRFKRKPGEFHRTSIWLKDPATSQLHSSAKRYHNDVVTLLNQLNTEDMQAWQFQKYRIIGPLPVSLEQKQLQMYLMLDTKKHRHLSMAFMSLPLSIRLVIPLVVSFVLCWLLAGSISRPLSNIARTAKQFGEGDLSKRLSKEQSRKDELGYLARNFNTMAEKLEQSMSAQQRLLGDVSHELRSPLTRLQMALGLVTTNHDDPEKQRQYLSRCELEISRLDTMLGDVLTLSRMENTLQSIHRDECDLHQLISLLIDDAQFIANEKSVTIHYHHADSLILKLDNQLIASAIGNILSNAVKYAPEQTDITVSVEIGEMVRLIISDNGPGVPEQTVNRLFEPFYRVDDDRNRTTGGTGLGLAIAKQAISLHQGNISAKNKDDGGLEVTVELPKQ